MRYLEKLRPVGRWENLLSLITLLSKLRSREIIFRGHCKPMFIFVFCWRYFFLVRLLLARWKNQRKKRELQRRFKAAKRCYGKGRGHTTSHKSLFEALEIDREE